VSAVAGVSVVVAVLNGADRLDEALRSIHGQTHPPAEIVVVDGGSADATVAVARSHPGVRVLAQEGDTLADAYNTGVAAARGSHVAFLSHDDVWLPGKLEVQLARLAAAPPADAAVGHVRFVLEPGDAPPPGFRPELLGAPRPARIMETLLAPREVMERVGPFRAEVSPADDVDWFARAQDIGVRVAVVPEVILRKRVHGGSTAHTSPGTQAGLLRTLRASIERKREGAA
jgi:glycosyltransferase involved in cell wall biosynthesis